MDAKHRLWRQDRSQAPGQFCQVSATCSYVHSHPTGRWAPGGAQHPEVWGEEWGDGVSAAQGPGARDLVRLLCWSQSLPAPRLVLVQALSCFMAYISVVCVVVGEEAASLSSGGIGRAWCVCWLSAGWAKQSLLPNRILSPCLRGLG